MPRDATPSKSRRTGKTQRPDDAPRRRGHGPDVPLYGLDALRREFARVDERLTRPVDAYLIGGGSMAFADLKPATKDVDIVLQTHEELDALAAALEAADYELATAVEPAYRGLAAAKYYDKEGAPRWDLYVRQVCRKLLLSPGMIQRARREEPELDRLRIRRLDPSDIFIFKTITDREADRDDMDVIHARGIPWEIVLEEMRWQCDHSETAWSVPFFQALEAMHEDGKSVPILNDLEQLADNQVGQVRAMQVVRDGATTRDAVIAALGEDADWAANLRNYLAHPPTEDTNILRRRIESYLRRWERAEPEEANAGKAFADIVLKTPAGVVALEIKHRHLASDDEEIANRQKANWRKAARDALDHHPEELASEAEKHKATKKT